MKLLIPARRRLCVEHVRSELGVSKRCACKVLERPHSTQRHDPYVRYDEQVLTINIVGLATRFGRYGYRRINAPAATCWVGCESKTSGTDLAAEEVEGQVRLCTRIRKFLLLLNLYG